MSYPAEIQSEIRSLFTSVYQSIGQPVRKSANQPFDQLITEERIKLATYCSMSQYFMSPSFPELTIKPASFFPFTIINLSLTHSTLEKRQTWTINNRILLLKIQAIIIVIYHLWNHHYHHHWRYTRTLWSGQSFSMHFCSLRLLGVSYYAFLLHG